MTDHHMPPISDRLRRSAREAKKGYERVLRVQRLKDRKTRLGKLRKELETKRNWEG